MADAGVGVYLGGGGSGEGFTLSDAEARRRARDRRRPDRRAGCRCGRWASSRAPPSEMIDVHHAWPPPSGVDAAPGLLPRPRPRAPPDHGRGRGLPATRCSATASSRASSRPTSRSATGSRVPLLEALADESPRTSSGSTAATATSAYLAGPHRRRRRPGRDPRRRAVQALTALARSARRATSPRRPTWRRGRARRSATALTSRRPGRDRCRLRHGGAPARTLLYGNGGIRATKAVLDRLGLPGGAVRLPSCAPPTTWSTACLAQVRAWGLDHLEGWDRSEPT